ncbi:MAG: tetratricopeptide repeat protein [Bacteroidales bacterium]|nr:tetratricopeptide repeat protein [Bacteroidales bacterium]
MKRIILALALLASLQTAFAQQQVKSVAAAQKAAEKAIEASLDVKKGAKLDTWVKLGKAYIDAYNAPQGNGWIGASRADLALLMADDKPVSEEYVEVGGQKMIKSVFATRNYYYDTAEILRIIETTKPIFEDALEKGAEAYAKAQELDVKGKKAKDIREGLRMIEGKLVDEAYNAYTFGNLEKASYYFEKAAEVSQQEPYAVLDTSAVYNAGLTAWMLGQNDRAKKFLEQSVSIGYFGEDGDAYAKLADIADKEGNQELRQSYLEEAFMKFPQSQSILVGLINYYLTSGGNTDRLFELIGAAKANEPENASLYYVEGNIYLQLNDEENAIKAYRQCAEINPEYEFGYIGEGQYWYNKAVDLQDAAAAEMDYKKYDVIMADFEKALKACVEPFEKAFEVTKDDNIKVAVSEYLKNACYRFSYDDESYKEKYDKYDAIVKAARQ